MQITAKISQMDTHRISSKHTEGMAFLSSINEHKLLTDSATDNAVNEKGPGPKRLMLVSLAGCTGIDIVSILEKMKVLFSDLSIDVEATLGEEHPKMYTQVTVTYKIKLEAADRSKMEKAVQLSAEKYCGVMAMFRTFATVHTNIEYL